MVNEDEAIAVNKELNEGSVLVMVAEVIMKLTLVMEMVVDKDVDVKVDEEVAKYVYNALKRNSPHKDQWMRMLVFAKQRQLKAAKTILCASTHLPSSKTSFT